MNRHLLYIVNPISGTNSKRSLKDLIFRETTAAGLPFDIVHSVPDGDYHFLKATIKEKKITDVIIAGGDGTVNAVIGSLLGAKVRFGVLPCGSGNGLAFAAGIPKNMKQALAIIFKGTANYTDTFTVNEQFACMLCGLGFDAQVAHDFAQYNHRGKSAYINRIIRHLFKAPSYSFTVTADGVTLDTEGYFMSIANSNQFGNNFTIAPEASLTDGWLDVVIVSARNKAELLLNTLQQVSGWNKLQQVRNLREDKNILYFRAKKISIINKQLAPLHIDGEPTDTSALINVTIQKKAFRLIYP